MRAHTDHLGTPRAVTDANGTVVWRWDGESFGATAANDDPDGNGVAFTLNLRFPGQYFDAETGLNYNYFRDYDPKTGRYVESDPIGLRGGLNTFGYVQQMPLSRQDPFGLGPFDGTDRMIRDWAGMPSTQLPSSPAEVNARAHAPAPPGSNIIGSYGKAYVIAMSIILTPEALTAEAPAMSCAIPVGPRTMTLLYDERLLDFTTSMFPGTSPAPTWAGLVGAGVGAATNPQEVLR